MTGKNNWILSIPDRNLLSSIDSLIAILKEIENSHLQDRKAHESLLQKWPQLDTESFFSYARRELWRIGSYILFGLNTKGVVEKIGKEMETQCVNMLGKCSPHSREIKIQTKSIGTYKTYRDKIFAHASYWDPKKDNLSTQHTTLIIISGMTIGKNTANEITLGGISKTIGNNNSVAFQSITFKETVADFAQHFRSWHKHLEQIALEINNAEDSAIERYLRKNNEFESIRIDRPN